MNYLKIYTDLIQKGLDRDAIEGYFEKHHIIPKCLGGTNKASNIVKLTAREHIIAHFLLVRIYPKNAKLKYAAWMMVNGARKERPTTSARMYEQARLDFIKSPKKSNKGFKHSLVTIERLRNITRDRVALYNPWIGKTHKQSSKEKMSKIKIGKKASPETLIKLKLRPPLSQEAREKLATYKLGTKLTEKQKESLRLSKLGDKNPMFGKTGKDSVRSKKVFQFDLQNNLVKEWNSLSDVERTFNLKTGRMYSILKSTSKKIKEVPNFYWSYNNVPQSLINLKNELNNQNSIVNP